MNNKKVKRFLGCICALAVLLGAIPTNFMEVQAVEGTEYYDVLDDNALQLHGVTYDETEQLFKRMDLDTAASIAGVANKVNAGTYSFLNSDGEFINNVYSHAREAAGGRIRFSTDSSYVSVKATLYNWDYTYASSMKDGKYGFDVYVDTAEGSTYAGTVSVAEYPTANGTVEVEGTVEFASAETRNLTIYFPITIETKSVEIGVETGSTIAEHTIPYEANQKIVFYGSSITQGGAVTKPGNTYVNTVGRNLNMEYQSYGVWGSAKGQIAFAEYIAGQEGMTAFVLDYDHNNATVNDLDGSKVPDTDPVEWTNGEYYQFYETIRAVEEYKDIPIIMVTRPNNHLDVQNASDPDSYSTAAEMKAFIRAAYEKAVAVGDENVHFVDGEAFFDYSKGYLEDNVHPNDAGQARMAEVMTAVLEKAFAGEKNLCVEPADCEILLNEDFTYEDGDSVANYWEPTIHSKAVTSDFGTVTDTDGNDVYQLKYERGSAGACISSVKYQDKVLEGFSDFAVEMNTVLEYGADYSYLALAFGEVDTTDRYELRLTPTSGGYKLSLVDRSNGTNDTVGETSVSNSKFKNNWKKEAIPYKIRVEVRNVVIGTVESQQVVVSVDEEVVADYTLVLKDQTFSPETIDMYLYTRTSTQGVYTATVDNIKVYSLSHKLSSVAEIPSTTEVAGTKAHYVCETCGKKFLDAEGIIKVTDADLILAKACCLIDEDFESGVSDWSIYDNSEYDLFTLDTIQEDDGTSLGQLQYVRTGSASTAYMQYNRGVLDGKTSFILNMEEISMFHSADTKKWSSLGLMFRQKATEDTEASTFEFRIQGTKTGLNIVPYLNGDKQATDTLKYKTIKDTEIGDIYTNYTEEKISYNLCMEVKGIGSNTITCVFTIGESEVEFTISDFNCEPTGFRIYLYGGGSTDVSQTYKATFDSIKIHTDSHTVKKVGKVASTDEIAGTKAHYECEACGKKFLDSAATQEVTDAQLAYAKLTDIKCQTRVNENGLTDIRFVAFVDDYEQYQSVTFKITLTSSGKSGTALCKDVYTAVYGGYVKYTTEDMYGAPGYFAAFKLTNNTEADLAEEMKVLVTWTDLDGNIRTAERTIVISQEQP